MAVERNSVKASLSVLILCLLMNAQLAYSAIFMVGDAAGWNVAAGKWANGKTFKVGDVLDFKYDGKKHNVVVVDEASYNSCKLPRGARIYNSGNDNFNLVKGKNFFVCATPGHCAAGMKIAVTAN